MCLLAVGWQCNDQLPFVFAGNRDEYHARPSAAADWWQDLPGALGGRDLLAGGSWLGVSRNGRFAVVTNRPDLPAPASAPLSRGELVVNWLSGSNQDSGAELPGALKHRAHHYGGFSLLTATIEPDNNGTLQCSSGGYQAGPLRCEELVAGVTGLSNSAVDRPWPKLTWLNGELARWIERGSRDTEQLFALLRRSEPVPDAPATGVSARPFIAGQEYGTRCSTVITLDRNGCCHFQERRFGPGGLPTGEADFEFTMLW